MADLEPIEMFRREADNVLGQLGRPHTSDEDYYRLTNLVIALCEAEGVEPHELGTFDGRRDVSWVNSLASIWDKEPTAAECALNAIRLAFG